MAKQMIPAECFKVLSDALEEFRSMMEDNFVIDEFQVVLNTSTHLDGLQITAKLHPENADEFVLEFE